MSMKDISFCYVVPDHHDSGSDDFGKHIPYACHIDAEPHDCLIDEEAEKGGEDEEEHLNPCLSFRMKDHIHAEDVVNDEGNGKRNGGGNQWGKAGVFRQCIKEQVFQKETSAAYGKETEDFPEPLHGWEDF